MNNNRRFVYKMAFCAIFQKQKCRSCTRVPTEDDTRSYAANYIYLFHVGGRTTLRRNGKMASIFAYMFMYT